MLQNQTKVLFALSTLPQAQMFQRLSKNLENYHCNFINVNKYTKNSAIENFLKENNLNYEYLQSFNEESIQEIIEKINPNIVITGNDQTLILDMFIRIANSENIPTLTVQDGILFEKGKNEKKPTNFVQIPSKIIKLLLNPELNFKDKIDIIKSSIIYRRDVSQVYGHGNSSKLAVFGENTRQKFIKEGVDPEKIIITGNPRFDELNRFNDRSDEIKQKMNISLDKKIFVITTQYFYEMGMWTAAQRERFIMEIAKNIKKIDNYHLIVKLHPSRENKEDYQEILDKLDLNYEIYQHVNLLDLLTISDVVITVSSTSGLEALALKKPLILVNLFKEEHYTQFFENSGALFVQDEKEMYNALKNALDGINKEQNEKFVRDNVYKLDGHSSQRIAKLIEDMASN